MGSVAAECFIFDLDGTIWDSRTWYQCLLVEAGMDPNEFCKAISEGCPIAVLLREYRINKRRFRVKCQETEFDLQLYPNVKGTLVGLRDRGVPLAIVTSLPAWIAESMIIKVGLASHFQAAKFYHLGMGKDKTNPILDVISDIGLRPNGAIWYVGDSGTDYQSALHAGISFAWASYGYGDINTESDIFRLEDFKDLLAL